MCVLLIDSGVASQLEAGRDPLTAVVPLTGDFSVTLMIALHHPLQHTSPTHNRPIIDPREIFT